MPIPSPYLPRRLHLQTPILVIVSPNGTLITSFSLFHIFPTGLLSVPWTSSNWPPQGLCTCCSCCPRSLHRCILLVIRGMAPSTTPGSILPTHSPVLFSSSPMYLIHYLCAHACSICASPHHPLPHGLFRRTVRELSQVTTVSPSTQNNAWHSRNTCGINEPLPKMFLKWVNPLLSVSAEANLYFTN